MSSLLSKNFCYPKNRHLNKPQTKYKIVTPLSRLAEPIFEEESCNLLTADPLLQEIHRGELISDFFIPDISS